MNLQRIVRVESTQRGFTEEVKQSCLKKWRREHISGKGAPLGISTFKSKSESISTHMESYLQI